MKILHINSICNISSNGVANAMIDYIKFESKKSEVYLLCLKSKIEIDNVISYSLTDYKDNVLKNICDLNKIDLVVFNEVYKYEYIKLYKECLKHKIPYVIIPHGCLVTVAQKNKRIKKTVGNLLLFNNFIKNASAIQFLNIEEKNDSNFKYKKYIISGNGIDEIHATKYKEKKNKEIVYIGRYSIYHKGLDMLFNVCRLNEDWFRQNKVRVLLYGRSTNDDVNILQKMIINAGIEDVLVINDAVYGKDKKSILESAFAFIQTSRHEGQPMGIIEALSYGLPCIVTRGTTFKDIVNDNSCGIGVEFDEKMIFTAIEKITRKSVSRENMSENAIELIKNNFLWDKIIDDLLKKYEEIIYGGKI